MALVVVGVVGAGSAWPCRAWSQYHHLGASCKMPVVRMLLDCLDSFGAWHDQLMDLIIGQVLTVAWTCWIAHSIKLCLQHAFFCLSKNVSVMAPLGQRAPHGSTGTAGV